VRKCVFGARVLVVLLAAAIAPAEAQTPPPPASLAQATQPVTGFVSSYEIMRTVRASGFNPLAPPLREGTDYVLRATDYRGILMRIVVDARTAAIRDVTRIVPGPGRYGQFYIEPAYGAADLDDPMGAPIGAGFEAPPARPPVSRPAPSAGLTLVPPLPRPRPATLASRDAAAAAARSLPAPAAKSETKTETKTETKGDTKTETSSGAGTATIVKPAAAPDAKSLINSEVITAAPPPAPAASKRAPVEPLND